MTSSDQPAPFQLFWQLDFIGGSTHVAYQVISYMISQAKDTTRLARIKTTSLGWALTLTKLDIYC